MILPGVRIGINLCLHQGFSEVMAWMSARFVDLKLNSPVFLISSTIALLAKIPELTWECTSGGRFPPFLKKALSRSLCTLRSRHEPCRSFSPSIAGMRISSVTVFSRLSPRNTKVDTIGLIDETSDLKKGDKTPGVQKQWCGRRQNRELHGHDTSRICPRGLSWPS